MLEASVPGELLDWAAVGAALRDELAHDPAGALVVIAGSLPPGSPDNGYARLASAAARAGGESARSIKDCRYACWCSRHSPQPAASPYR